MASVDLSSKFYERSIDPIRETLLVQLTLDINDITLYLIKGDLIPYKISWCIAR